MGSVPGTHAYPTRQPTSTLEGYIGHRQTQGRANATINNELALLRRAFNLAKRRNPPKVQNVPVFEMLPASKPRQGFFEDADFQRLLPELPAAYLHAAWPCLLTTRVAGARRFCDCGGIIWTLRVGL